MIKVLYAGSPEAASTTLKILLENADAFGFEIVGVLTNPPAAKGRHKELIPTPVEQVVKQFNLTAQKQIPVFSPEHLNALVRSQIEPLSADILVCFAYGHIFGPKFLSMFKFGGINLHPSLLPKYRGCSPIPEAILNGDQETAFTIQTLVNEMDAGNILAQQKVQLDGTETSGSLLNDAAIVGAKLICDLLLEIKNKNQIPIGITQIGNPSYTKIIKKEDGKIDWKNSATKIEAQIRAYSPEPGTFCITETLGKSDTLRILEAKVIEQEDELFQNSSYKSEFEKATFGTVFAFDKQTGIWIKTGNGILCVTKLQRQGKNAMGYKDFMNGARNFVGTLLK